MRAHARAWRLRGTAYALHACHTCATARSEWPGGARCCAVSWVACRVPSRGWRLPSRGCQTRRVRYHLGARTCASPKTPHQPAASTPSGLTSTRHTATTGAPAPRCARVAPPLPALSPSGSGFGEKVRHRTTGPGTCALTDPEVCLSLVIFVSRDQRIPPTLLLCRKRSLNSAKPFRMLANASVVTWCTCRLCASARRLWAIVAVHKGPVCGHRCCGTHKGLLVSVPRTPGAEGSIDTSRRGNCHALHLAAPGRQRSCLERTFTAQRCCHPTSPQSKGSMA